MTAPLQAVNIEFSYPGGGELLRGVDLELKEGEVLGVIGKNGSGKTTLINILAWSIRPRKGEVLVHGRPAGSLSDRERARNIAMVPQEPTVAFPFTVIEIALMGRAPYLGRWELEGKDDLKIAAWALEMTGLEGLSTRRFHELSGGERQRVMIAKALAQDSGILLLDEPTAFLDLKHQVEIYELVRKLARERGLAVLAVTHDVNLAAVFCDRVAALWDGRIEAAGRPAEVLEPSLLRKVYGVEVGVATHPQRGDAPLVFPLGSKTQ